MSCEISLGLLEDISRITAQHQNFVLRIETYNHSRFNSPTISLAHPSWDYQYILLASQKEIIKFDLCSLDPDYFMKVLATGKFDIRDYVARHQPSSKFVYRLPLYSDYNNQALLHLKCKFGEEPISRNQGIKQISKPSKKLKSSQKTSTTSNSHNLLIKQKYHEEDKQAFFKGPCDTRNVFSFLDQVFKGQTFNFIEPVKK